MRAAADIGGHWILHQPSWSPGCLALDGAVDLERWRYLQLLSPPSAEAAEENVVLGLDRLAGRVGAGAGAAARAAAGAGAGAGAGAAAGAGAGAGAAARAGAGAGAGAAAAARASITA